LPLETKRKQQRFTLAFLLLGFIATTTVLNTISSTLAQTTTAKEPSERKDIFKVLMTVQGLDRNSGDIVTIVSVNGGSRVKLFDDTNTYVGSINADGTGGIIEYAATFPNMTVNVGDEYKVCALALKDSNLICQTGNNSPALRPEVIDLYLQQEKPTTSQAAILAK
jgi:hypothetical protein